MNLQEIEKLLERYFEGETTLSEEQKLRDYFTSGNVPVQWKSLEGYFNFIIQEQDQHIENPAFDDKVMSYIKENKLSRLADLRRPWIYWISGVAASILILIAVFVKFDPFSSSIADTYKDPQTAYIEARKILLYVSAQLNKGTNTLEPVSVIETGINELKPVATYSLATGEVTRLNEVENVNKMIGSN